MALHLFRTMGVRPQHISSFSSSQFYSPFSQFRFSSSKVDTSALLSALSSRSLLHSNTSLPSSSPRGKMSCYFGVDPTSSSLHVGHLPLLFTLCHAQRAGFKPIILVGGATGRIGDPSGKSTERPELPLDVIDKNVQELQNALQSFWDGYKQWSTTTNNETIKEEDDLLIVNNEEWYKNKGVLEFLGSVGRNMNVATMLSRESVQSRMGGGGGGEGEEGVGISLLEFMYQAFQAFDFVELNREHNCTLQLGGADQWGNIVGGCQLVRRMRGKESEKEEENLVGGITVPLLETASGQKIGKSAGNAVFLDPEITNDYDLYQWFLRAADNDVEKFLNIFTLMEGEEIKTTVEKHWEKPETRIGQIALAREAVGFLRGERAVKRAEFASEILFGKHNLKEMEFDQISDALSCFPTATLPLSKIVGVGLPKVLAEVGLSPSVSAARRTIKGGGVSLNQQVIPRDSNQAIEEGDLIFGGRLLYLQVGKKEKRFVLIEENISS